MRSPQISSGKMSHASESVGCFPSTGSRFDPQCEFKVFISLDSGASFQMSRWEELGQVQKLLGGVWSEEVAGRAAAYEPLELAVGI